MDIPSSGPSMEDFLEVKKVATGLKSCPKDIGTLKKKFSVLVQGLLIKK